MSDPEYGADTFEGDSASLSEVCEMAARQALSDFYAVVPGVVVSYDADKGVATIQPAVQKVEADGAAYPLQPVPNVRVLFMGTAGADIVLELAEGDTGLLLVSSLCMDQWVEGGDASAKPTSTRRGDMADGVFLPARLTKPQAHTPGPATRVLINAAGEVTITSTLIKLGSASAANAVADATLVASVMGTLKTWLDTHTHTCAAPAAPASPPIVASPSAASVAFGKVKAE
jgi:hypothetical protein